MHKMQARNSFKNINILQRKAGKNKFPHLQQNKNTKTGIFGNNGKKIEFSNFLSKKGK